MIYPGLVSVTFRKLKPVEIISLAAEAGLYGIEWGGDIHVPHGNITAARRVRKITEQAGLHVVSYGSYYRAGIENKFSFLQVLDTACELDAPVIRVWAGKSGSACSSDEYRQHVTDDIRRIAELALSRGKTIALEYHKNTLADNAESVCRLLNSVNCKNVGTYWQLPGDRDHIRVKAALEKVKEKLVNLHIFYWEAGKRMPLKEGEEIWREYLAVLSGDKRDRHAMIEFVNDDCPQQFTEDAEVLKRLCDEYNGRLRQP